MHNYGHMPFASDLLAANLRTLLRKHDLSANELAERIGLPQPTITRMISGETKKPRIDTLCRLADYFGISVSQLIGEVPLHQDARLGELEKTYSYMSNNKRNTALSVVRAIAAEPDAPYQ